MVNGDLFENIKCNMKIDEFWKVSFQLIKNLFAINISG